MDADKLSFNQDRVALVTGASRGIGCAIAKRLLHDGYSVIGTATTEKGASLISGYESSLDNRKVVGIKLDVSDADEVSRSITEISNLYSTPLVLINNAGVTKDKLLLRMDKKDWSDVINTNLNSLYYLSKACVKGMTRARWGRIVNITSVVAAMGNPGQSNYAASKAGAEGFTRSLACELGQRNITVNNIAPGFIDTDMTKDLSQELRDSLISQIPLGRLGNVDDVASLASFLCSENGNYITGETIQVNGGMYLK